jgi:three-Cys-motif partner protein
MNLTRSFAFLAPFLLAACSAAEGWEHRYGPDPSLPVEKVRLSTAHQTEIMDQFYSTANCDAQDIECVANRIEVLCGDANQLVRNFCLEEIKIYDRAVIFLDPYGNHVAWDTVKTIAAKPGIDLWYLFPAGVGVVRQMSHNAQIQKDAEESLDQMFGDHDWFSSLTEKNTQLDMLDHQSEARRKVATADATTRYMIAKMKTIFDGRVLEQWLPLGKQGGHWYSLIFAWSNPSKRASTLASRVAREIMRRK